MYTAGVSFFVFFIELVDEGTNRLAVYRNTLCF